MFSVDLQPNEKVFKIYRQSEWVLAKTVIGLFILVYVPAFLLVTNELLAVFGKWLAVWVILVFLFSLYRYILWLLNSYVITDSRLLIVTYFSLFKKEVVECHLNRIQNLKYSTTGFFSSLLNFGNLEITISGIENPIVLKHIRRPEDLKNFLWSLKEHFQNPPAPQ